MSNFDAIMAFDGVCNLCNSLVKFIFRIDRRKKIGFVDLESPKAAEIFGSENIKNIDSVMLIKNNTLYFESDAVLEVFKTIGGGFFLIYIFKIIPRSFRDRVYRYVALKRYKWFGKKTACAIPSKDDLDRYLK